MEWRKDNGSGRKRMRHRDRYRQRVMTKGTAPVIDEEGRTGHVSTLSKEGERKGSHHLIEKGRQDRAVQW